MTKNAEWGYEHGVNDLFGDDQNRTTDLDTIKVHFGDVTARCESFIRGSQEIVGAIAWMKSPRLVQALARRPTSIILNKEFELRRKDKKARQMADKLKKPATGYSACVRVIGDQSRGAFTGLMHHKFLIRLTSGIPEAVWNGSFNLTSGAGGNFENGMEIHDVAVALAFYDEFRLLWDVSEPLNFKQGAPLGLEDKKQPKKR